MSYTAHPYTVYHNPDKDDTAESLYPSIFEDGPGATSREFLQIRRGQDVPGAVSRDVPAKDVSQGGFGASFRAFQASGPYGDGLLSALSPNSTTKELLWQQLIK